MYFCSLALLSFNLQSCLLACSLLPIAPLLDQTETLLIETAVSGLAARADLGIERTTAHEY
jgi:hypothetical protein